MLFVMLLLPQLRRLGLFVKNRVRRKGGKIDVKQEIQRGVHKTSWVGNTVAIVGKEIIILRNRSRSREERERRRGMHKGRKGRSRGMEGVRVGEKEWKL